MCFLLNFKMDETIKTLSTSLGNHNKPLLFTVLKFNIKKGF